MSLSYFKDDDQEKADRLLNQYDHNMMQSALNIKKGNFRDAGANHREMTFICDQLQYMKNEKETIDQIIQEVKDRNIQL